MHVPFRLRSSRIAAFPAALLALCALPTAAQGADEYLQVPRLMIDTYYYMAVMFTFPMMASLMLVADRMGLRLIGRTPVRMAIKFGGLLACCYYGLLLILMYLDIPDVLLTSTNNAEMFGGAYEVLRMAAVGAAFVIIDELARRVRLVPLLGYSLLVMGFFSFGFEFLLHWSFAPDGAGTITLLSLQRAGLVTLLALPYAPVAFFILKVPTEFQAALSDADIDWTDLANDHDTAPASTAAASRPQSPAPLTRWRHVSRRRIYPAYRCRGTRPAGHGDTLRRREMRRRRLARPAGRNSRSH